jgi:5-methyltetrahydropteroyltriglutamate--homocysteine methyltransferase
LLLLGNFQAQHHHGVPMQRLLPIVLRAKPQGLLFEAANPRHAHEWWGTDCGFGTFASFGPVEPDIAYLKLRSLVEGAQFASRRLWS